MKITKEQLRQMIKEEANNSDEPTTINKAGDKWWEDSDGKWHRDNGPAVVWRDGTEEWYRHGVRHRDDGPAVVYKGNTKDDQVKEVWIKNDKIHRDNGPAIVYNNGKGEIWFYGTRVEE